MTTCDAMLPDFESAYTDRRKRRRLLFLAGARLLRLMADTNTRKRVDYMAPRRLFDAVECPWTKYIEAGAQNIYSDEASQRGKRFRRRFRVRR